MRALGRTARRLSAVAFVAFLLLTCAAALAPQDALAQPAPVLTATADNGQITLRWTVSDPGFNSEWQYRQKSGAGDYGGWMTIPGGIGPRSYTVPGLTNGTNYTFQVRGAWRTIARILRSSGGPSNAVTATQMVPVPTLISGSDSTIRTAETTTLVCYNLLSVSQGGVTYLEARQGKTAVTAHSVLSDASLGVEITQAPAGITKGRGVNLSPCVNLGKGTHTVTWSWRGQDGTATAVTTSTTVTITDPVTAPPPAKTVTISTASTTITEGDSGKKDVTINIKLGEGTPTRVTFDVEFVAGSSTATDNTNVGTTSCSAPSSGADICYPGVYSDNAFGNVNNGTNGSFKIGILGDTVDEGTGETVALRLVPNSLARSDGWTQNSNTLILTITDNDSTTASVPAAPTDLSATAGNAQVTLTWTKPAGSITGYKLRYAKTPSKGSATWGAMTGSGAATVRHTVTSLDNDAEYSFMIRAVNATGDGAATDWVTATPAAASTKTITLSAASTSITEGDSGSTDVTVTVTLGEGAPAGFSITVTSDSPPGTAKGSNKGRDPCTAPLIPADTDWCYPASVTVSIAEGETQGTMKVRILGDTRDEPNETIKLLGYETDWTSGRLTLTIEDDDDPPTTSVPAKPAGLSAEAGNAQVELTWTDPEDDSITRYQLRQKKGRAAWGSWAAIPSSDADTVSHTVTGLDNDVEYRFRIRARNGSGNSAQSAIVEATPSASAAVPKPVLSAAPAGYGRVKLSWSALSGVTVASWGYEYKSAGGSWSATTTVSDGSATSATVTGLTIGTEYKFRLFAAVSLGVQSVWSDEVKATPTNTVPKPVLTAAGGDASVTLSWSALTGIPITSWGYQYKSTGGWSTTTTVTGGSRTSVRVTGLTNETKYTFRLFAAVSPGVQSSWSDQVKATPVATAGVRISPTSLTVEEGSSNTYTVKLNTAPSSDVTITVSGESGDVTVTGSPLTFTSGNYNTAQTITVNAATDEDTDNDTATLTHTAASGDTDYGALPDIDDVSVTVTDTTPTLQLLNDPTAVTEGTAISLTVTSDRELTGDLTVSLTLADRGSSGFAADDITGELGPRDFTASFGATARTTATVTIPTATDSDAAEGVETYRITLNDGDNYAVGNDVTADGTLNDAAAKTVSVPGALTVAEDAGTARITITASTAFGEAVTFNITYGGTARGESDPTNGDYDNDVSSVSFNASETAKDIVIPITDDDEVESDETITVTIAPASALPDGFTLSSATTTVTITDNDTPEGTMSVTAGAGQVTLTWEDPSESRIAKWQYQQKAAGGSYGSWIDIPNSGSTTTSHTVTGLTNDTEYSFKVRAVDSSGSELKTYQEVSATPRASVSLSIADVSADEGGTFAFTVTATQAPASQISFKYTVTAEGEDTAVAGEDFTAVSTATEGSILADATTTTITVSVTDDSVDEDDETFTVTLSEPSEGVSISDGVAKGTIIDNDIAAAVTVAPTELVVEEGASGAYTVALDAKPTGEVTITVSGMAGDVTVDNSSLKFTVDNWDTEQTVTVSAGQDDDAVADAAVTLTHSASGGGYDAVEIDLVEVTITEDDTAGVKVEPTSLTVKEGSSGTYAVALETEPTDEVTITVSGMAGDVTVDKTSLKFTVDNWDTEQTVTVSAANDKDLEDETVTLTHSASGGDYSLVKIDSVQVTVEDATAERLNKINRAVLPRVTAAMMSQSLDAISYRIEAAALGGIGDSTLSFGATPGALSEEEYVDALWPEEESEDLSVGMREALNGAQFSLGLNGSNGESASQMEDGKMPWAVWGRGNWMSLSGSDEDITWDGGLWSAHLGADVRLRPELLLGWAVSRSEGDFDADGEGYQGLYETSLTSVHPYVAWLSPGGSSVWGSVGYGRGNVRVGEDQTVISRADLTFTTAAIGGRLALGQSANMISGGVTRFAIKGEGSLARSKTEADKGLEELEVDVRSLRLALQASHERVLEGGATVTPSLEIGVRHDGGDIDGGAGLEAGATLSYNNPVGLTLEVRTRALLDHNRDWEEWGMGASVTLEPGADQRGAFLKLESSRGETASGIDRLFDRNSAELLTTGGIDAQRRLDAEIGHGFGIGDVARTSVLSPYAGIGLEDQGGRYWRFGTRYRLGEGIDIDLEGARREQQSIDAQNCVMLKGNLRW